MTFYMNGNIALTLLLMERKVKYYRIKGDKMTEINVGLTLLDLVEKVGNIQGTQKGIMWAIAGFGSVGVLVVGYLGRCVYFLGREISNLKK